MDTFIGGNGNEVSPHPLSREKIDLSCVGGSNSFKHQTTPAPFENLGIESTLLDSTPWFQSLEGVDYIVLQPKSFPSKKLSNKKKVVGLKSLMKCGVEGQIGHIVSM